MDTVDLHGRVEGAGQPIVLMHGLFGSHRNWFSIQRQLMPHWLVHGIDLRNHGQSGWADEMSYSLMAADVLAYLDHHQLDSVVLLGHSMGGKVAMSVAAQAAARLRGLVLVDIAPVVYPPSLRPYLNAMMALDLTAVQSRSDADKALRAAIPAAGVRGFLLQNLVKDEGAAYRWRINLKSLADNFDNLGAIPDGIDACANVSAPVTAIYGEQSDYMRATHRNALQSAFPNVQMAPVAGAGHWVHAEQPKLFADRLSDFLAAL